MISNSARSARSLASETMRANTVLTCCPLPMRLVDRCHHATSVGRCWLVEPELVKLIHTQWSRRDRWTGSSLQIASPTSWWSSLSSPWDAACILHKDSSCSLRCSVFLKISTEYDGSLVNILTIGPDMTSMAASKIADAADVFPKVNFFKFLFSIRVALR